MNIRNTYWIVSLSLLLSVSIVLPFCCHADMSELLSHQQEMSSDLMHGQHQDEKQCKCGHVLVKDFQKTKKVVTSPNSLSLLAGLPTHGYITGLFDQQSLRLVAAQPDILADTAPPIHLLNSVFLN